MNELTNSMDSLFFSIDDSINSIDMNDVVSTPEMCLIMNRDYQEHLEELISLIEDKLEENRFKQQSLTNKLKCKSIITKENSYLKFTSPYFRDQKDLHPPPNSDTILKKQNKELNQNYVIPIKKWTINYEQNLMNAIEQYYLKDELSELVDKKNELALDKNKSTNEDYLYQIDCQIKELDDKILELKNSSHLNNLQNNDLDNKIDWLFVSKLMDDVYDNLNCKLYWINYLHPKINKQPWTAEETDKLGKLTNKLQFFNWERLAEQLNTNRKAWQVAKQYQITFNSNIKHHGPFTNEEIKHLTNVIEKCKIGDYIPWNQVIYFIEGRSVFQLKQFWEKYLKKNQSNRYWSLLEDAVLSVGHNRFSYNWKTISFYLPGRSNRQCRERFINRLSVSNRRVGNWTAEEDKQILKLIDNNLDLDWWFKDSENILKFKDICKNIKNRSDIQIKNRIKAMKEKKEIGERITHKKNKIFELETIRLNFIHEKMRRVKDVDSFLCNSREILLNDIDKKQRKICDLKFLKSKFATKRALIRNEEEAIDNEIVKMFDHYNLIPNKYQLKPNLISSDNLCLNEVLINYLDCLLDGKESNDNYLLNNVIKYLFKNQITDLSNSTSQFKQHPPILPPNRSTMLGFFGVLMHEDNLKKIVEDNSDQLDDFDLDELKNDDEYKHLVEIFYSLFLLPAILTDTTLPIGNELVPYNQNLGKNFNNIDNSHLEDAENDSNNQINEIKKSKKRKNSRSTKYDRTNKILLTTKIRQKQKELISSYLNFKKQNC